MPTKTADARRTAGTLAVDRIEYRKTDRRTSAGDKPIADVYVDGVRIGEVAKAKGTGWLYVGVATESTKAPTAGPFYFPATKDDAAIALVVAALTAGTITDMDEEARAHATTAANLAEFAPGEDRDDAHNLALLRQAVAFLSLRPGIRVGDYVATDDGRTLRVGHMLSAQPANRYNAEPLPARAQLTASGRFHLSAGADLLSAGAGSVEHSGGYDGRVDLADLVDTGETRLGSAWIWHHGRPAGGGAVEVRVPFRVFAAPTGA